jgi:hypothetical protein
MHSAVTRHPTPEELLAFTDGEATPEVERHVAGCAVCTANVDAFASVQTGLRQTLYRFDCPEPHALGEYELDLVSPEQRVSIASHVTECDACALELRSLREFMAMEISAPEPILARLRRVVAALVTPSPGLGLAGVRGVASPLSLYKVEGATVSIDAGSDAGSLVGLLTLDDPTRMRGSVRLLPPEGAAARIAELDELGNFEFFDLASDGGVYTLEIHLSDEIIVIEDVRLD